MCALEHYLWCWHNWNCNSQHALHGESKNIEIKYYFYAFEHDEKRARLDSVQLCWANHFSAQHFAECPLKYVGKSLQNNVTKCIVHAIPVSQILENNPEYENLLAKPGKWTLWRCTNESLHVIPSSHRLQTDCEERINILFSQCF